MGVGNAHCSDAQAWASGVREEVQEESGVLMFECGRLQLELQKLPSRLLSPLLCLILQGT